MLDEPPSGFRYQPDLLTEAEEGALAAYLRTLDFVSIEMRGQIARRRTTHFGWIYGYESWRIEPGPPIPAAFLPLRARAARVAGVDADELVEVLVTEYPPGAGIGWHRDAPQFGTVIGVSFLAPCRMRFRRGRSETRAFVLEPRSAYVLDGAVRWAWQHSIPPTKALRYSVTFRTLRDRSRHRP